MIFAIDFDGTIVEDAFPEIGRLRPEAENFIRALQARGDKWILYTMREDESLDAAFEFLHAHGLIPDAVNDNLPEMCRRYRNNPRKVYADVYIDDHNAGGLKFPDRDLLNINSASGTTPTTAASGSPAVCSSHCRGCAGVCAGHTKGGTE